MYSGWWSSNNPASILWGIGFPINMPPTPLCIKDRSGELPRGRLWEGRRLWRNVHRGGLQVLHGLSLDELWRQETHLISKGAQCQQGRKQAEQSGGFDDYKEAVQWLQRSSRAGQPESIWNRDQGATNHHQLHAPSTVGTLQLHYRSCWDLRLQLLWSKTRRFCPVWLSLTSSLGWLVASA